MKNGNDTRNPQKSIKKNEKTLSLYRDLGQAASIFAA